AAVAAGAGKSVHQSVLPEVFTTRFPSLPSNVLPARFALAPPTNNTAKKAATTSVPPAYHQRRVRRLWKLKAAIYSSPFPLNRRRAAALFDSIAVHSRLWTTSGSREPPLTTRGEQG